MRSLSVSLSDDSSTPPSINLRCPRPRVRQKKCQTLSLSEQGSPKGIMGRHLRFIGSLLQHLSILADSDQLKAWIACLYSIYLYDVMCRTWSSPVIKAKPGPHMYDMICTMEWTNPSRLTQGQRVSLFSNTALKYLPHSSPAVFPFCS